MQLKNKKAVSEIVSYVLLIIIAVSVSVLVYNYLVKFVPKGQTAECPEGVSLIVSKITCPAENVITLTLSNRGLWSISGVYIKAGKAGSKVKETFREGGQPTFTPPLAPSSEPISVGPYEISANQEELEIIPIIKDKDRKDIICTAAIITEPIICEAPAASPEPE